MRTFNSPVYILLLLCALLCDHESIAACSTPNYLYVHNVFKNTADVTWPVPSGASGYFVAVNTLQTPNGVSAAYTTSTSYTLTGLNCGVKYYVFVRSYCSPGDTSAWIIDSFITTTCCYPPTSITITPTKTTANVVLGASPSPADYEYYIGTTPTPPQNGIKTSSTSILLQGLTAGTTYYFCVRSRCTSGEPYSQWVCDTFQTPDCTPPDSIVIVHTTPSETSVFWPYSAGAGASEYYIGFTPPPASGWQYTTNGTVTFNILPDTTYYVCVRLICQTSGAKTAWTCDSFHTPPLGVGQVDGKQKTVFVFPNPVHDQLFVKAVEYTEDARLEIINSLGRIVMTQAINKDHSEVDISSLAPGVYMVKYTSDVVAETTRLLKE